MSHLQLLLFILLITGCATAQEDVIYFSKTGMTEKDSVAYFFHGDDGSVGSSGWFDYNGGKKETMSPSGQHVTLLRRAKLADGSKGGLEIMTWRNLSGGSEVEFPEFSEKAYQAPIEVQYTFGNCEGISEAVYSGNMNERLGVKMNDNGNLSIGSKVSPADKGVLFLKEGNPAEWKYLKTHPNAGAGGMIDCKLLETGVSVLPIGFPAGSLVQGTIKAAVEGEEFLVYQFPVNVEGQSAPQVLYPENFGQKNLKYDFIITPVDQRNLFLGRRVYSVKGFGNGLPTSFTLPTFQLNKEYVTEGGFAVETSGKFQALLANYGLEVPANGKTASIKNRSQWKIFGPANEGRIEITLPQVPKELLEKLIGGDYIRVYNSVTIHLYQYKNTPDEGNWKQPASLLEGKHPEVAERIEYRAWIKEMD